jgi:putative ABC transport system permease protein
MLKHNIKLFFRNIKRYKSTFLINILGLSTGLACTLLIALWVVDELQFDKFHANDEYLYQVWNRFENPDGVRVRNWTPELLAETMADKLPEVKYATAQTLPGWFGKIPLFVGDKTIKAPGIFADEDYFNIFSYELLQGDRNHVLDDVNTIVISESLAKKLFGTSQGVIGKVIEWDVMNTQAKHQVTGVFKDIPSNSTHQFDFILPFETWKTLLVNAGGKIDWGNNNPVTYLVLEEGTNVEAFSSKIENFSKLQSKEVTADLILTKYSSNYLYGNFENGRQVRGRMDYVYLFSIIALFILIIACVNFMNLSTANASRRLKEIGVKKALGSKRGTLIRQYFGESILTALASFFIALLLVTVFIPQFNGITGKTLALKLEPLIMLLMLSIVLFTGLLAGSYPALHLSRFNPVAILRGRQKSSLDEIWIRKGLVVFQFSLSIILIVGVLVVYQQIEFVQSKNLGMNKDNLIHFQQEGRLLQNGESFLNEVRSIPGIDNIAITSQNIIGSDISTSGGLSWSGNDEDGKKVFHNIRVGHGFTETMDIKLKEGRTFSKAFATDSTAILFNEAAIKMMGLENPVGKTIKYGGEDYTVIGVLRDFHFQSLREVVKPMFFRLINRQKLAQYLVRIERGKEGVALAKLKKLYTRFNPGYLFEYTFLDNNFQAQYVAEQRVVILSKYFAGLAILISCLGLFGLAAFTAERRKKEISIRKVLGQNAAQAVTMLSNEFAKLVLVSILIALPIAYILANNWLSGFAYRIPLKFWYFLGAGAMALLVAIMTVGSQAVNAAGRNPVDGLREE